MGRVSVNGAIGHWSKLVENLQVSPQEFYDVVEQALERRQIPKFHTEDVTFPEAGAFSARRAYLRVRRLKLQFEVCAAPFGAGSFFSWWLVPRTPRFRLLWGVLVGLGLIVLAIAPLQLPRGMFPWQSLIMPTLPVVLPLLALAVIALLAQLEIDGPEGAVLAIPLLGALYARVFTPETFYTTDTTLMFQTSVHAAVMEALDGLMVQRGLRALSAEERKPILRAFV